MSGYSYLFGPVPSRRLGRSLGIDLVPFKTCNFDCIFCEVGETTSITSERREYVPVQAVIEEFDRWLAGGGTADYVTFSGSGEPTLHSRIGDVVEAIRERCGFKIALLTNSTLLWHPEVRAAVAGVDLVKVSLSVTDDAMLAKVNRHARGVSFKQIIEGIQSFRNVFTGVLWHEVFVLKGINDNEETMRSIASLSASFKPDKVHLNTVTRTPATTGAIAADYSKLVTFAGLFTPSAEVIADRTGSGMCEDSIGNRPQI